MATKANLLIDQGTTFETTVTITDDDGGTVNLTGYTAAAQSRQHYTSNTAYNFTVSVNGALGQILLSMSANTTMSMTSGRYVYDCELTETSTGKISRVLEGIVTVTPNITR